MKFRKNAILFLIFINVLFFVNGQNINYDFNFVISIDNDNINLIKSDTDNYKDFFFYFCVVSDKSQNYEKYKNWFNDLEKTIESFIVKDFGRNDINNFDVKTQKKVSENILLYLHNTAFKKYVADSTTIDLIVEKGEFNCVSSSILYSIFLLKYGIKSYGIETIDHVFVEIDFQDEKIDVETTNKFGFDPGKKPEVLDDFGKLTGFSYVPAIDYRNRNKIDLKKTLFLVYHNLSNLYFQSGNYFKAANLGYLIFLGRNDAKGNEDFNASFNNLVVVLTKQKKYIQALDLLDNFLLKFGTNNNFINIRFDVIGNYITEWNDFNNYKEILDFLLKENNKFAGFKDNKRFLEIQYYFNFKVITFFSKQKDFEKSYALIKEFNNISNDPDMEKIFTNTLIDEFNSKKLGFIDLLNRFNDLKKTFSQYVNSINKNQKIYLINEVQDILNKNQFEQSIEYAKQLKFIYPGDSDIDLIIKNSYIKWSISVYEKKDYEKSISISEIALKEFSNDSIITNNHKVFLQNYIVDLINSKDFTKARKIVNYALNYYPNDSNFIKMDKYLKDNNA